MRRTYGSKEHVEQCRRMGRANRRHGLKNDPSYKVWESMKARCLRKSCAAYPRYGGRGITICDEWLRFEGFYKDMGTRPPGMSLDRVDNDGPYSKENCRWATRLEQQNNTRAVRRLTLNGETKSISQWAKALGVSRNRIRTRLQNGMTQEQALLTPKLNAWTSGARNKERRK